MYGTPSLKDPKPGDAVAYHNGRDKDPVKVAITKVTATQVVVDGCLRFMRSTGCLVGHSGRHAHIEPWTTEVEQRIAKRLASEALAERRKQVLARLSKVTSPVEWMPNPQYNPAKHDNRVAELTHRPLGNRRLDMVESLTAELERIVAETVAAIAAPHNSGAA